MNFSQIRSLKDGDKVIFKNAFPPFTVGKAYSVEETKVGRMVYDDAGVGRYLSDLCEHFAKEIK